MLTKELKDEIRKGIDSAAENVLNEVLNYLQSLDKTGSDKLKLSNNLNKILEVYK